MRTVGVDLAAEPVRTAIAVVEWESGAARLVDVRLGVTDADIVGAVTPGDRVGIDAPFGWPDAFVDFVTGHHRGDPVQADLETRAGRQPLVRRRTDLFVHRETGLVPLSVSADLLAHVALRCAGLLGKLAAAGVDVGRVSGAVVESYPAAALKGWGLPCRGYKGTANRAVLAEAVSAFEAAAPGFHLGRHRDLCAESDHAFDAVVAAVIARAADLGRTRLPDGYDLGAAEREGWIHLPTVGPAELVTG
ncbi:DUF429 domain-containing protein [Rhodococcus gannanensis]|uniref:DUF429 domain-containing protein n=1 Tax=Rhodococcus gannanensis TaxID=1960308 RepID=A0ABW4P1R7_9NOCA